MKAPCSYVRIKVDKTKSKEGAFMIKSIQQFQSKGVKKLEKIFIDYSNDLTKVAEMVQGVTASVVELGCSMIAEEWEFYDEQLRTRTDLRKGWEIIRRDPITRLTSLGEVTYKRTYFKNKETGERRYLVDELMGFGKKEYLTEDAVARIFDEAADSSYRKGGMNASISGSPVSKETVMDKLHPLKFPKLKTPDEKRVAQVLYIDADEDHVSLQYLEKKGDVKKSEGNTFMPKLVYVYEGLNADEDRHELVNAKYFGGGYQGTEGTAELWKEVYDYISQTYEEDAIERIYVNGDGAEWIKKGAKVHAKAKFVLDKYHMHKYILAATAHLKDSAPDARNGIWHAINGRHKKLAETTFDKIIVITGSESKRKAVETSKQYILGHWSAIMNSVRNRQDNIHCSAEGHVSHIYSDRLSSRPLGWSVVGADKMAQLRVYKKNGRDMLELVRYQKKELPMAAGAEEKCSSASEVLRSERKNRCNLGAIADLPMYSIPYPTIRKIAAIKDHIWGL
jgi:hypothetical protein